MPLGRTNLLAFVIAVSFLVPVFAQGEGSPRAHGGTIDLRDRDLAAEVVPINGEWQFLWQQLVPPERQWPGSPDDIFPVPRSWHQEADDPRGVSLYGFGTYRLEVLLGPSAAVLGLRIPQIGAAAWIYWNGVLVYQGGVPGTSRAEETPAWKPGTVILEDLRQVNELRVLVSNHHDLAAGILDPIHMGNPQLIFEGRQGALLGGVFVIGVLAMIGVYHLFLFAYRPRDRSPVLFGMICLLLAMRVLVTGEFFLWDLLPAVGFETVMKISYLTFSIAVMLFPSFLLSLFPDRRWRYLQWITWFLGGLYSVVILVTPAHFYTRLLFSFQMFTLVVGIALIVVLIGAIRRRMPGAILFLSGFGVLFLATVNDILNTLFIIRTVPLASPALVVFIFFQSLVITKQFAGAFASSERLSHSLQRFVPSEFLGFLNKNSVIDIELGDHSEEVMTVLFLDIRSFTNLSEALTPAENFNFINSFLGRMGPIVRAHNGFVDKYLGDGLMALFPGSAGDAVAAAVALREELRRYNVDRARAGYSAIDFGVGIHAGELMLGTIGESLRMDGTVISDTVNLASRLETLTKEYHIGIAISAEALEQAGGREAFGTRYLGTVNVKGKSRSVAVFEIFDGEDDARVATMRDLAPVFNRAMEAFEADHLEEAGRLFADLRQRFPEDAPTAQYMAMLGASLLLGE